jgi:protein-S-isoprenylcysteine O-methyltransferase Ste14
VADRRRAPTVRREVLDVAVNLAKLVGQLVFLVVLFGVPLFGAAGTLAWLNGWVFVVLFFTFVVSLTTWLYKNNPALLTERMTVSRSDQKTWDKVLLGVTFVLFIGWLILMPLDALRFHWSALPPWLQLVGALILIASFFLFFATFRENTFLSPVVRIQQERGQTVVSTGPYHVVRHPMYAAFVLFVTGTALLLGSWWGLAAAMLLVVIVARRAVLEERVLRDELEGYRAYMSDVRFRLVPRLW